MKIPLVIVGINHKGLLACLYLNINMDIYTNVGQLHLNYTIKLLTSGSKLVSWESS